MSIDLPLHDLVGNILGVPVYRLFGAKGPTHVPIYSSSIHLEDLEPWGNAEGIPRLLRECQVDYDLGYRAFKVKIGRGLRCMPGDKGRERDIAVTRAVRERFPDCKILVDANNGYTEPEFEGVSLYCHLFSTWKSSRPFQSWRRSFAVGWESH
jgi:L-alanine-DL-glutamate epimerase-like enolase superfamily enzyme